MVCPVLGKFIPYRGKMCKKRRILQAEQVEVPTLRRRAKAQGTSVDGTEGPAPPAADGQGGLEIFFAPARAVQNAPPSVKTGCVLCAEGDVLGRNKFCRQIALPFCRRCAIIGKNPAALQGHRAEKILPPANNRAQRPRFRAAVQKPPATRSEKNFAVCKQQGAKTARKENGASFSARFGARHPHQRKFGEKRLWNFPPW